MPTIQNQKFRIRFSTKAITPVKCYLSSTVNSEILTIAEKQPLVSEMLNKAPYQSKQPSIISNSSIPKSEYLTNAEKSSHSLWTVPDRDITPEPGFWEQHAHCFHFFERLGVAGSYTNTAGVRCKTAHHRRCSHGKWHPKAQIWTAEGHHPPEMPWAYKKRLFTSHNGTAVSVWSKRQRLTEVIFFFPLLFIGLDRCMPVSFDICLKLLIWCLAPPSTHRPRAKTR